MGRGRLIVATGNPGKLREFRVLLADLPFDVVSQPECGVASVAETGTTFLENAWLKARNASAATGSSAVADDSGLEVDVLGGAPGIFSARFAGEGADDAANNAKLMAALEGVPAAARGARYRCVLVYLESADAAPVTAEGTWDGFILEAPRGTRGFGYDPYFWVPQLQRSAAELDPAEKNQWSHRGIACAALHRQLARRAPS